jgi:dipeptidase D
VAYALALLEARDIPHPALEVVLTSDEETGLDGAFGLDKSRLFGRLLINVDSDVEGVFIAGCAGGLRADVKYAARDERIKLDGGYKLSVSGLQGGHSGVMINEGRLNANRLLFEVLSRTGGVQLSYITGGSADNVIPRTAECVFTTSAARADIEDVICAVLAEARGLEPAAQIELFDIHGDTDYFSAEDSERFIGMLCEMPLGVIAMCRDIPTLVETSLNMGILSSDAGSLSMTYSIRSAVAKEKQALYGRLCDIATKYGAKISSHGDYPGWEYRRDSHLRDIFCKAHKELYGKDAEVVIIHAGLECGIFSEAIEGLDCISLGPTNYDIHTAEERLSISSTARVWRLILKVLSEI